MLVDSPLSRAFEKGFLALRHVRHTPREPLPNIDFRLLVWRWHRGRWSGTDYALHTDKTCKYHKRLFEHGMRTSTYQGTVAEGGWRKGLALCAAPRPSSSLHFFEQPRLTCQPFPYADMAYDINIRPE